MIQDEITLAFTGASGALYGWKLLNRLVQAKKKVSLLVSPAGALVIKDELDLEFPGNPKRLAEYLTTTCQAEPDQIRVYAKDNWYAPLASGSGAPAQMVVCPCSVGFLSAVATGASNNLIERAADVVLKERGKLILVIREMPLSEIHLQNMLTLARMGAVMMPASPGFYYHPKTVDDIVDFVVARVLDQLNIEHHLLPKWGFSSLTKT